MFLLLCIPEFFLVRFYIFYPAKYFIVNIEFILLTVYCEEEEMRKPPVPSHAARACVVGCAFVCDPRRKQEKKTKTECLCFLKKNNTLFV